MLMIRLSIRIHSNTSRKSLLITLTLWTLYQRQLLFSAVKKTMNSQEQQAERSYSAISVTTLSMAAPETILSSAARAMIPFTADTATISTYSMQVTVLILSTKITQIQQLTVSYSVQASNLMISRLSEKAMT